MTVVMVVVIMREHAFVSFPFDRGDDLTFEIFHIGHMFFDLFIASEFEVGRFSFGFPFLRFSSEREFLFFIAEVQMGFDFLLINGECFHLVMIQDVNAEGMIGGIVDDFRHISVFTQIDQVAIVRAMLVMIMIILDYLGSGFEFAELFFGSTARHPRGESQQQHQGRQFSQVHQRIPFRMWLSISVLEINTVPRFYRMRNAFSCK